MKKSCVHWGQHVVQPMEVRDSGGSERKKSLCIPVPCVCKSLIVVSMSFGSMVSSMPLL